MSDPAAIALADEAPGDLPGLAGGTRYFECQTGFTIRWWIDEKPTWPQLVCSLFTHPAGEPLDFTVPGIGTCMVVLDPWCGPHYFDVEPPQAGSERVRANMPDARACGQIYLGGISATPNTRPPDWTRESAASIEPVYLHVHCRLDAARWFRAKIAKGTYASFFPALEDRATDSAPKARSDKPRTHAAGKSRDTSKRKR
jgi:hypothetical protein